MKKNNLTIKTHNVRENTPDSTLSKRKIMKKKPVASITPSGSITNLKKKINNQKNLINNPVNNYISTTNILSQNKNNLIIKSKIQKEKELNKTVIEPKKEIKKEYKTFNPNDLKSESRAKSAVKRPIKPKNKDKTKKEENKKEEIKKEEIKKEENKKEENKKEENKKDIELPKKNINRKESTNNDDSLKSKDITNKQKVKKDNRDFTRKKSFDINLDKNKIKQKETTENNTNNTTRKNRNHDNSLKKRKLNEPIQKTPNKIKNINYDIKSKDIAPLKTTKSGDRSDIKFEANRNKKQIMNKTPDSSKMRNRKNYGGTENIPPKKQKYGKVDIKSIIKKNDNIKKENNNKEKETKEVKETKKIEEAKKEKIIKYRKIRNKTYNNNYVECLFLALNSGFFNPNKKLNLILDSKELFSNINQKVLIKELIDYYNKVGNENIINNNKTKYDIKKINEPFKPNERCINALNFIDKTEQQKLINEIQHPYIIELFNAVIILLNEYKNKDENKNIFEYFFNDILVKYNVKNLKKLMINNFVNMRLIINDEQFELIQKMLMVKPDLFSPATLLRYNRAVAYFSFFVKELYSYLNLKTNDGKFYYKIRASLPKNKYQEKINKLKLIL